MTREIMLSGKMFCYKLTYKNVKNINVRIKPDGSINVSASKRVPLSEIEGFLKRKADFIINAAEGFKNKPVAEKVQYFTESEIKKLILKLCEEAYPYFEKRGVKYPEIRFRKMVSRWGSCHPVKGVLTFNTNLMYAPEECVKYVVLHEFTHFLQANHSAAFYKELEAVCPMWRKYKKTLKEINIR